MEKAASSGVLLEQSETTYEEDAHLLTSFLSGEGRELVEKYQRWIIGYCLAHLRNCDVATAEEIAQEVWMTVLEKAHTIRQHQAFCAWLHTTVHNITVNYGLRRRPHYSLDQNLYSFSAADGDPVVHAAIADQHAILHAALTRLGEDDRSVLLQFHFEGKPLMQIAAETCTILHPKGNTPLGTIKRRLHVARKRLGKEIKKISPSFKL